MDKAPIEPEHLLPEERAGMEAVVWAATRLAGDTAAAEVAWAPEWVEVVWVDMAV